MQMKKLKGIIINETNYSESSKILSIYTKELGIISAISKGCRKIKSPLRSVSNRFTYGEFILNYKQNGLSTITGVDVINNFKNIMLNITNISYATYILELATQVAKQNEEAEIFNILISSLTKIDEGLNPEIITLTVELKYLMYLGIDINIDCCSCCGSKEEIITLNVDKGGYICKDCYENEALVTQKTIKVLRLLYYADIDKITKLELNNTTTKELSKFLEEYYDKYSGLYLKSKKFINILNNK